MTLQGRKQKVFKVTYKAEGNEMQDNGIQINETKSIRSYGKGKAWFFVLTHRKTAKAFFSYMKTVLIDFFFNQFSRKFHFKDTPILRVDNELDNEVPFTPAKIEDYLQFVALWIRPLSMLAEKLDSSKAQDLIVDYLKKIEQFYAEAGDLYRFCMTTTARPKYYKNASFIMIHAGDPHFLCVPSLHIAVVTLCYSYYRTILKMPEFSEAERELWTREIYEDAINIAETVLYVKQHSVNCIPAALYMMTFIMKDYFAPEDGVKFINDLFVTSENVTQEGRKKMIDYMQFIYERFLLEGLHDDNWKDPVKKWLSEYAEEHGQHEVAKRLKLPR